MSVVSNNVALPAAALRALMLAGGDTGAVIEDGTEGNPATRGAHLLVKYNAPLNKYYEEWHGRVLHAFTTYATGRYGMLHTQRATVAAAMGDAAGYVTAAWNRVGSSLQQHSQRAGVPAGLADADRRYRLAHAGSQVAVATVGAKFGADTHKVDYDDARKVRDTAIKVFAAMGQTSADMLANAVDYSGQTQELQHSARMFTQHVTEMENERSIAAAEASAKRKAGIGGLIGMVAGAIGKIGG